MSEDPTRKEVYVTELAGPDDRWVSVTDASRIGRRQEHTIRAWIAQGVLPVNPTRVGINKKTRQVRLSDLATVTPILDPDAGIATDWGTLDLPSIPKQQQQLAEQMAVLERDMTGQLANLGGQLVNLAGGYEQFAGETRQTWQVHQQQLQQVCDQLTEQTTSYSRELHQTRQDLSTLVARTEQTLREVFSEQVEQNEAALRQALETVRENSAEATAQVRRNVVGLEERLASAGEAHEKLLATVSRQHAHSDQQFSQVSNRLEPLETTLGKLQSEIQKHVEHVDQQITEVFSQIGQFATQVAGLQSTWQELARASEQEARQFRRDLDAQGRLQQALQQQFAEERKAREELARRVSQLLKPGSQKGVGHS